MLAGLIDESIGSLEILTVTCVLRFRPSISTVEELKQRLNRQIAKVIHATIN